MNAGVFQKVSELILKRAGVAHEKVENNGKTAGDSNPYHIPQVRVDGLDEFLEELEKLNPSLEKARGEIERTQTVSFYPGLGELFTPGAQLVCHPEGMEGSPLGCSCVQSWYTEELNKVSWLSWFALAVRRSCQGYLHICFYTLIIHRQPIT
jgi:hypothetical protein